MKSTLIFAGILNIVALSPQPTCAANKIELLNNIAERFELASTAFNGHVDSEIKTINQDSSNSSDDPRNVSPMTFMAGKPGGGGGMVCYYSDSLSIAATSDPNYRLDGKFDAPLAQLISENMNKNGNDVAEIERNMPVIDKNNNSNKSENFITVAWQGKKLTGSDTSKLVCAITAPLPAG